jgi:hypothetical protein
VRIAEHALLAVGRDEDQMPGLNPFEQGQKQTDCAAADVCPAAGWSMQASAVRAGAGCLP